MIEEEEKQVLKEKDGMQHRVIEIEEKKDRDDRDDRDDNDENEKMRPDYHSDDKSKHNKYFQRFIDECRLVVGGYLILGLVTIVFIIIGYEVKSKLKYVAFIFVEICLLLGSLFGVYGVYIYGTVDSQTLRIKSINEQLQKEASNLGNKLKVLRQNGVIIEKFMKSISQSIDNFRQELRDDLQPIQHGLKKELNIEGKEILNYCKTMNNIIKQIESTVVLVEKYRLIQTYYHSDYDESPGLDEQEYIKFFNRLLPDDQLWFQNKGSFHQLAGEDNILDRQEFYDLLDQLMNDKKNSKDKKEYGNDGLIICFHNIF